MVAHIHVPLNNVNCKLPPPVSPVYGVHTTIASNSPVLYNYPTTNHICFPGVWKSMQLLLHLAQLVIGDGQKALKGEIEPHFSSSIVAGLPCPSQIH